VIQPNRQKGIAVGRALAESLTAAHEDSGRAPRVLLETEFVVGATTAAPSVPSAG